MKIVYPLLILFLFSSIPSLLNAQSVSELPPPPGPPDACDMGGIYSVGAGGNFVTITEALDSLKKRGVSTNVVLELNASYNSNIETFPIRFPKDTEIPCYGGTFSLVLRPAADVTNLFIQGSSASSIFRLDSCSYVTIDGRPGSIGNVSALSIVNDGTANAVDFYNANHNSIIYTSLSAAGTENGNVFLFYGFENGGGCNYNSIKHCKIFSPVVASAAKPVLFYSKSDITAGLNSSDTIMDCEFYNFSQSAIDLDVYSGSGWVISGNSFYKAASYNFRDAVYVIKINSLNNPKLHTIENNFFGGTAANCSGGVMDVGYRDGFTGIWLWGEANIRNNKFARLYFHNSINSASNGITMVYADGISNILTNNISNNQFGGADIADSIHVTNDNTAIINETGLNCIYAQQSTGGTYFITGNYFSGIKCYSNSAHLSLIPIAATYGNPVITNNQIGEPSAINSIFNTAPGFTYGISCVSTSVKINGNTICRIKNSSACCSSIIQGISVRGGSIDSICNNTIFHLENSIEDISSSGPLVGIVVSPQAPGGLANLIEGNNIHSLYNNSSSTGGTVSGILSNGNVNIRRNFIHNLNSNSEAYVTINGIFIPDKESVVENNMISLGFDSSGNTITPGNLSFYGIVGGNVLRHNTVSIGGNAVGDGLGLGGSACFVFIGSALNTEYHNNIFSNTRSSAGASLQDRHQCINIGQSFTGNNNLFYYNGQGGILGTYQNTRYTTLAQWQAGSSKDAASLFANPLLVAPAASATGTDLHVQYGSPVDAAGNSLYTTTNDFDGEQRSLLTPVDIGADAGDFASCPVADAGFDYATFDGGTIAIGGQALTGVVYSWTGPNSFTSTAANPLIDPVTITASGMYVLTVTTGSCTSSDTMYLQVLPPFAVVLCPDNDDIFLGSGNASATTYQWQVDTGSGYANMSNNAIYSGINSDTLRFANPPSSLYGFKYRCIADGLSGGARQLKFQNEWTGAIDNNWGNTGNWSCDVLPDGNTDVIINSGTIVVNVNGFCRSLSVAPSVNFSIAAGFNLTIVH